MRSTNPKGSVRNSTPNANSKIVPGAYTSPYTQSFAGKGYPIGLLLALTYIQQQSITFYPSFFAPNVNISTLGVHNNIRSVMPSVRIGDGSGSADVSQQTTRYMLALALTSE